ncbi:MAG: thioredoxin, partial [Nitrosopumilaceae archaeon]|nr:thioredoxin [Nitrosopumilaceae archaeon]
VAFNFGKTEEQIKEILTRSSKKLLAEREKRIRPGLDDKVLTSWNALMITAFAKGYQISQESKYLDAAENCVKFIEKNLFDGEQLLRTYKDGKSKIQGYLDDYSYFVNALLDVFEITSNPKYLNLAKKLAHYVVDHFWDSENNSFFMTADNHEKLIIRPKSNYDLSVPSGNSVSAFVLLKLYHITHENNFLDVATKLLESQAQMAAENPFGFGFFLNTMYLYLKKPTEITILNTKNKELCKSIYEKFIPESIIVSVNYSDNLDSLQKYPFFEGKNFDENKTQVFVCKNFTCSLPLEKIDEIESHL